MTCPPTIKTLLTAATVLAMWPAGIAGQQHGLAHLTIAVAAQGSPLPGAEVRSAGKLAITDTAGRATLTLPSGMHRVVTVWTLGYSVDTLVIHLRAGQDTTSFVQLSSVPIELAPLVVRSLRGATRVERETERVEIMAPEDVQ